MTQLRENKAGEGSVWLVALSQMRGSGVGGGMSEGV